MSETMEEEIKRWTARRKSALVLEIIQGKMTVAVASRQFDLTPAEIESWVEDGKRGMENALRAKPEDVREQYERQLNDLQEAYGEAMREIRREKVGVPAGKGRELMRSVQQGLKAEGIAVPMTKLCRWFGVARRTTYYKPTRSPARVKPELGEPIKEMIEAESSFGYRTVAALLGMNRNTVRRIFQLKGWQVRKRALGQRPRIEAKVKIPRELPDQRCATDLCRVWGCKDGWLSLALVTATPDSCWAGTCRVPVGPAPPPPPWSKP